MIDVAGQEIEPMLLALVLKHGEAQVKKDLGRLFHRSRWDDYQRVFNLVGRIARRLEQEKKA
jgi:hypothetical protein